MKFEPAGGITALDGRLDDVGVVGMGEIHVSVGRNVVLVVPPTVTAGPYEELIRAWYAVAGRGVEPRLQARGCPSVRLTLFG